MASGGRASHETEAFIDYYENHHVPLVLSLASTHVVYKRNYLVWGDEFNREDDAIDFDVVTELVFSERAGFLEWVEKLSVEVLGQGGRQGSLFPPPRRRVESC